MATLVLSTIGRAVGGPAGAIVGGFVGAGFDRVLAGGGGGGGRLADLAVQSSAYGEAVPRLYGRIRVAGALIWSTGLIERSGGKGGGDGFSYATSAAIVVSARPIGGIGRVWADGRLVRDAAGVFSVATGFRVHDGSERQVADPLIAAAEGAGAPAYRGRAYVVFEDLQLAEFGNRLPQFTFEVFADGEGAISLARIADDLFAAAGAGPANMAALDLGVTGYGVGRAGSLGEALAQLSVLQPHRLRAAGGQVVASATPGASVRTMAATELGARAGSAVADEVRVRSAERVSPSEVTIGYFDAARDYQPGLQRATGPGRPGMHAHRELPVVAGASEIKALSEAMVSRGARSRATRRVTVSYRHIALEVGDRLVLEGDAGWRVAETRLEAMALTIELEQDESVPAHGGAAAEPGRLMPNASSAQGPTTLRLIDLATLPDETTAGARLLALVAPTTPGWRYAVVSVEAAGGHVSTVSTARRASVLGLAETVLGDGPCERWDEAARLDVRLDDLAGWLESRDRDAVLAGANLALVGSELIAFRAAEALGGGKFRLSGMLRGRFGSEWAAALHVAGESFAVIDLARAIRVGLPALSIGSEVRGRAVGPLENDAMVVPVTVLHRGEALLPLSPSHVRAERLADGTLTVRWTRRSRFGFAWIDGADAPLGEEIERYLVTISPTAGIAFSAETEGERIDLSASEQLARAGGAVTDFVATVAQSSGIAGWGRPISARFVFSF